MTALAVGMNTVTYDAVGLKKEATKGLNFAQTLEQQPTTATNTKVAQWLKKGLSNENYSKRFNNVTVIEIARIIDNNSTTEATVTALLMVLLDKKTSTLKNTEENEDNGLAFTAGFLLGASAILCAYYWSNLVRMLQHGDIIEYYQVGDWTFTKRFNYWSNHN